MKHSGDGRDIMESGDTVTVTLEDDHGHTYDVDVRVDIKDDVDTLTSTVNKGTLSGCTTQTHLNFVTSGATYTANSDFETKMGEDKWDFTHFKVTRPQIGVVKTVEMFSSSVRYYYNEKAGNWTLEQVNDRNGGGLAADAATGAAADNSSNIGGRQNFILTKDGLGIRFNKDYKSGDNADGYDSSKNSNWGGDEFGTSNRVTENGGHLVAAEAIVLENTNKAASYGMEIEFGNFAEGEKAIVAFYMTPQHSNDDNVVMLKEVGWDNLMRDEQGNLITDENGKAITKVLIQVPDGFTKAIIAPLPGGSEMTEQSSFTIKSIDMTRPGYEQTGQVIVVNGADSMDNGTHQADLAWDWSAVKAAMLGGVILQGTMYDGGYGITWADAADAKSFTVYLKDGPGEPSYAKKPLFTASLGADGQWKITQFYDFVLKNGNEPVFDVKFSIKDGDDDVTELLQQISLSQPELQDRFQHVINGYWNEKATGDDNRWGEEAKYNDVVDMLAGTSENDLINGLGGNDVLIGDGYKPDIEDGLDRQAIADLEAVVLGPDSKYAAGVKDYVNKTDDVDRNVEGDNKNFRDALYDKLTGLTGEELDEIAFALEDREVAGGDDALLGGLGNDMLFGGAGNDYLVGNGLDEKEALAERKEDHDIIFGGSGADIILYDDKNTNQLGKTEDYDKHGDKIVHGGSGIDVLLVGSNTAESLAQLMSDQNHSGTIVRSIEVMIKTNHTNHAENMGVTSLSTLASVCGVYIDPEANTMTLSKDWKLNDDGTYAFKKNGLDLTLETNGLRKLTGADGKGYTFENMEMDGGDVVAKNQVGIGGTGTRRNDVFIGSGEAASIVAALYATDSVTYDDIVQNQERIAEALRNTTPTGTPGNCYSSFIGGRGDDILFNANLTSVLIGDGSTKDALRAELGSSITDSANATVRADIDNLAARGPDGIAQAAANLEKAESTLESIHDGDDIIYSLKGVSLMHGGGGDDKLVNEGDDAILIGGSGDDTLIGGERMEFLFGGSGDDKLYGGAGDDYLCGGSSNDYLDGGDNRDWLYGGEGNDLIVYDPTDYLIDGGDDAIDFLLAGKEDTANVTLGQILDNADPDNGPLVSGVEVLLKGEWVNDLTSLGDLKDYGITLSKDGKSLTLDGWTQKKPGQNPDTGAEGETTPAEEGGANSGPTVTTWTHTVDGRELTLETTLVETGNAEAENAVHTLQMSNG